MKILFKDTTLIFSFVPRIFPLISDNLTVQLKNEMSNESFTVPNSFTINEFVIMTLVYDFKIQDKFEMTIKNGSKIIFKDKILILKEGTDVQNYEYNTQKNEYYKFK